MPSGTEQPWYAALPQSGEGPSVRWSSSAFETELREWVGGVLGGLGTDLVSLEAVHQRPWSTVWRGVASDGATYWAKQNCVHQSFEAALLVVLDRLSPHRVVPVAEAAVVRGLLRVGDRWRIGVHEVMAEDDPACMGGLAEAMHLQRELVGHTADLVGAGVTTLPPVESAAYVEARVASLTTLAPDDPRRMGDDVARRLRELVPAVTTWADDVVSLGLPDCLVHNDLHASNVFATADGMRFFDFGDALLAHPLSALFVPLNVLLHRFETTPDDARLRRVADAAIEVWGDVVPVGELRTALPSALRLGRLGRAESWLRVTATLTPGEAAEYGDSGTWWLGALGDEPPLT
jgi:hypothetical protein